MLVVTVAIFGWSSGGGRRPGLLGQSTTGHLSKLIEATKQDVGYVLMIDGEQVGFALPADLNVAMDGFARKVRVW